jgi:hypothetical protein
MEANQVASLPFLSNPERRIQYAVHLSPNILFIDNIFGRLYCLFMPLVLSGNYVECAAE